MALIYPEWKQCAAESGPVHFPLEWNLKAQKCHKKLGSHKVSTEILQIQEWSQLTLMKWCALVFFPSLQMNHLYPYIKHRERLLSYSTSPRSLVRNNHKENHLSAFCWGWEVTFASFPIHSYLRLDLIEADYSLISIPFLNTPLYCSKLTWSLSVCCLRKRCHVLVDTGPVTWHLIGSEADSENSRHWTKCVLEIVALFY